MNYLKQIIVGVIVIVVIVAYAVYSRMGGQSYSYTAQTQPQQQTLPQTSLPTPTPASTPVQTSVQKALYKDGTYTGAVADAYFGTMQVEAIISDGKLTDVQFLQYPKDSGHSAQVNAYSNPILRSEAIQSQSANVDIVSGATQSSQAFQRSLASALVQAKV